MKRGRKPDAPALKVVKGTVKPGDAKASEELLPLGPVPDDWKPPRKAMWHEVVNAVPYGVVGKPDRLLVELAVNLLCQMRADPATMTPALATQIRVALGELGLTPGARARLEASIPSRFDGRQTAGARRDNPGRYFFD